MKRIIDKDVMHWVLHSRDRACLYGFMRHDPCEGGLSVHHIQKRSHNGDDVPGNLITLCLKHHNLAELHEIDPDDFRKILRQLYGYSHEETAERVLRGERGEHGKDKSSHTLRTRPGYVPRVRK